MNIKVMIDYAETCIKIFFLVDNLSLQKSAISQWNSFFPLLIYDFKKTFQICAYFGIRLKGQSLDSRAKRTCLENLFPSHVILKDALIFFRTETSMQSCPHHACA